MATITKTFYPTSYDTSASNVGYAYNWENVVGQGMSNMTTAASFHASETTYYQSKLALVFDLSEIPSNATIDSVQCSYRACVTNTSYQKSAYAYLSANNTQKGSTSDFLSTSYYTSRSISDTGTWTRSDLNGLRLNLFWQATSTVSAASIDFYGAELTITYTADDSSSSGEGSSTVTETVTLTPSSDYTCNVTTVTDPNNFIGNNSSSTSYCRITLATGSQAQTSVLWWFDISSIPEKATIDSVSAKLRARTSSASTSYISKAVARLCSLATGLSEAKGSEVSILSTSTTNTVSLSSDAWTREELDSISLWITVTRGTSSTSTARYLYLYGADLTVTYTYQNEKFMLKLGADDSWIDAQKVYKKDASGNWVEQTDLSQVIDSKARYKYGGHIIPGLSALPSGYTLVEYIESAGTSYIDTGFMPNNNTRVVIDFKADNTNIHVFGSRTAFTDTEFVLFWASGSDFCVQMANSYFNGGEYDNTARHTVDMSSTTMIMDGETKATYSVDAFQCAYNMYLFSCPNSNESENLIGKIYSCKVYDNGTMIRDYVPCVNSSGVAGMYDMVNGVFYPSVSSTQFVAGPQISSGDSSANLISFTINGTSYQAEEGMTWAQWVASSYNNDGWANIAERVVNSKDEIVCLGSEHQYAEIRTTDTIISGYAYDITI